MSILPKQENQALNTGRVKQTLAIVDSALNLIILVVFKRPALLVVAAVLMTSSSIPLLGSFSLPLRDAFMLLADIIRIQTLYPYIKTALGQRPGSAIAQVWSTGHLIQQFFPPPFLHSSSPLLHLSIQSGLLLLPLLLYEIFRAQLGRCPAASSPSRVTPRVPPVLHCRATMALMTVLWRAAGGTPAAAMAVLVPVPMSVNSMGGHVSLTMRGAEYICIVRSVAL